MVLSQKVELEEGFLRRIADDPETVELEGDYGVALGFMRKFTRRCWRIEAADIERIRAQGIPDADMVDWIQMGAVQTLAVNQADGGGIWFPEEGGSVVGHDRAYYAAQENGLTALSMRAAAAPLSQETILQEGGGVTASTSKAAEQPVKQTPAGRDSGWFEPDFAAPDFLRAAAQTKRRYGLIPNLLVGLSKGRSPSLLPSLVLNLELLEAPRSTRLTRRQHAAIRARTAAASRSSYSRQTILAQLEATGESLDSDLQPTQPIGVQARDEADDLIFSFAEKAACNAYKITEKDVVRFRELGLGDEAYLDVLGTVGLQLGLDRMACATGVLPDEDALLGV